LELEKPTKMIQELKSVAIVIPCFNSADTLHETVTQIDNALKNGQKKYEVRFVLVNDASQDSTWEEICKLKKSLPSIRALNLRRNCGEHNSVMAGLRRVKEDAAVIVDDDLQHPPEEILKLLTKMDQGFDVVYGRYRVKQHSLFRNFASWINDKIANRMLKKPKELYLSSFKAIRKSTIDAVITFDTPFVYIDGLIFWVTQNITQTQVEHLPRQSGSSNYSLRRLIRLHLDMLLGFSSYPLRLVALLGFTMAGVSGIVMIAVMIERLSDPNLPLGWASIILCISFIGGMILAALGVIGEYLGRIFILLNKRPQSIVKEFLE